MARRGEINYTIIFSAAFLLVIIAAIWGYLTLLDQMEEPPPAEETYELSEEFYGGPDPVAEDLLSYSREALSLIEINVLLDDAFELHTNEEDITADGRTEVVVIERHPFHPTPARSLRENEYTRTIKGMIIYRKGEERLKPVFILTPGAMRNERGDMLIEQIRADHGYAMHSYTNDDEEMYPDPVKIFNVVLLDERGQPASDDITIYWDPASGLYRATNTFGAPGTFSD
ncbi:MAG: hypothetical protein WD266_11040 [Balneolales bacterium]